MKAHTAWRKNFGTIPRNWGRDPCWEEPEEDFDPFLPSLLERLTLGDSLSTVPLFQSQPMPWSYDRRIGSDSRQCRADCADGHTPKKERKTPNKHHRYRYREPQKPVSDEKIMEMMAQIEAEAAREKTQTSVHDWEFRRAEMVNQGWVEAAPDIWFRRRDLLEECTSDLG